MTCPVRRPAPSTWPFKESHDKEIDRQLPVSQKRYWVPSPPTAPWQPSCHTPIRFWVSWLPPLTYVHLFTYVHFRTKLATNSINSSCNYARMPLSAGTPWGQAAQGSNALILHCPGGVHQTCNFFVHCSQSRIEDVI